MTEITADNLIAAGYRPFTPNPALDRFEWGYQKWFTDESGRLYALTFRQWPKLIEFDAQVCCETATNGYAWITLREPTIEQTENRALALWQACGSIHYDLWGETS